MTHPDTRHERKHRQAAPPQVSVVMPAWNCERYIGRAIDSVLSQTLRNLELIIIDDGSTDNTLAIARACRDPRLRILRGRQNQGPAHCRNRGIDAARGEWIALLDADDWFCPTRLETLCSRAIEQEADAIADDLFIVEDGRSRPRATLFAEASCALDDGAWLSPATLLAHEIGALKPVFRRTLFSMQGHRYDESLRYGEDVMLYLSWLRQGSRLLIVREAGYYLRRGDTGSLTSARLSMARAALALNQRLLEDHSLQASPDTRAALARRMARARDLLVFHEVVGPLRARDFSGACKAVLGSPRFLLVALRRAPAIIRLRLARLRGARGWREDLPGGAGSFHTGQEIQ